MNIWCNITTPVIDGLFNWFAAISFRRRFKRNAARFQKWSHPKCRQYLILLGSSALCVCWYIKRTWGVQSLVESSVIVIWLQKNQEKKNASMCAVSQHRLCVLPPEMLAYDIWHSNKRFESKPYEPFSMMHVCVCMVAGRSETENALVAIVPFKSSKREIPVGVYLNYLPK